MNFIFITLFENLIRPYFDDSILGRALKNEKIKIYFFNPRDFTANKYKKVDSYMIGGGAGLLINTEPLAETIKAVLENFNEVRFIFPTPAAKKFTAKCGVYNI